MQLLWLCVLSVLLAIRGCILNTWDHKMFNQKQLWIKCNHICFYRLLWNMDVNRALRCKCKKLKTKNSY